MIKALDIIPGFNTSPTGDMLGLLQFAQTLQQEYEIEWQSYAWDLVSDKCILNQTGKVNFLICHSYGGAAAKRCLNAMEKATPDFMVDYAVFLDPVPRWLWGQFPGMFGFNWTLPKNVKKAVLFHQTNFPPFGVPFKTQDNLEILDVTHWEKGLFHCDIPGSVQVQMKILRDMDKIMENLT